MESICSGTVDAVSVSEAFCRSLTIIRCMDIVRGAFSPTRSVHRIGFLVTVLSNDFYIFLRNCKLGIDKLYCMSYNKNSDDGRHRKQSIRTVEIPFYFIFEYGVGVCD